jgi:integrase
VLRWRDVDLERGIVRIHRAFDRKTGKTKPTKTGTTRDIRVESPALGLLRAMGDDADAELVVDIHDLDHLTKPLRKALLATGVDRPALHDAEPTSKAMTWYDLRATGITWRAVRGDSPMRIQYDAGHKLFATTQGYIRAGEAFAAESFGEAFAALPSCLFGDDKYAFAGSNRTHQTHAATQLHDIRCEEGDLNPHSVSTTGT